MFSKNKQLARLQQRLAEDKEKKWRPSPVK
jgi:hypothetical protein